MKKIIKFLLIIFLLILAIIMYARYVGTMGFITKEYTVKDSDLPTSFDGIKIVHFSDLHYKRAIDSKKIESIVEEINLINPDIVVFTGDLIDKDTPLSKKDYDTLVNLLSKINSKYGKYAVMGNHDYYKAKDKVIEVYESSNFKYLENSYDIVYSKNMEKIFIGGLGNVSYNIDDIAKLMDSKELEDDNIYKIILVHEPDITSQIVKDYSVDLILAGHSHNGQVVIPMIGPIYKPNNAKKYYDNYYQVNDTSLYISSGIGVSTVNYRLFNRPSINFYRINKD